MNGGLAFDKAHSWNLSLFSKIWHLCIMAVEGRMSLLNVSQEYSFCTCAVLGKLALYYGILICGSENSKQIDEASQRSLFKSTFLWHRKQESTSDYATWARGYKKWWNHTRWSWTVRRIRSSPSATSTDTQSAPTGYTRARPCQSSRAERPPEWR